MINDEISKQTEENLKQFNRINNTISKASESIGITVEQGWKFFSIMTENFTKEGELIDK